MASVVGMGPAPHRRGDVCRVRAVALVTRVVAAVALMIHRVVAMALVVHWLFLLVPPDTHATILTQPVRRGMRNSAWLGSCPWAEFTPSVDLTPIWIALA